MIEITCNDRLGKKVRVKCNPDDTIGDLKKLIAAQIGTKHDKIILKKWYRIFNDNITLGDCKYMACIRLRAAISILNHSKSVQNEISNIPFDAFLRFQTRSTMA